MEITLKSKYCLYVIIPVCFFSVTICNLLIDFLLYKDMLSELNVAFHKYSETLFEYVSGKTQQIQLFKLENILKG